MDVVALLLVLWAGLKARSLVAENDIDGAAGGEAHQHDNHRV